jgi:hypothetical protein
MGGGEERVKGEAERRGNEGGGRKRRERRE